MTPDEIRDRIKEIIHKVANVAPATIGDNAALREDLGLDSLSLLEVGVNIDYEFKLGIPNLDERMPSLATVGSAVALVEEILREKSLVSGAANAAVS